MPIYIAYLPHGYWICHPKFKEWEGFKKINAEKEWGENRNALLRGESMKKKEGGSDHCVKFNREVRWEKFFIWQFMRTQLFNKCLLNIFSVPSSMLGTSEAIINKIVIIPIFMEFIGQRIYGNI